MNKCDATTGRRENVWSSSETACEPTKEEVAAASNEREREAAKEAEARRNAYFADGTDEGGRSKNASSDPSTTQPWTNDSQTARNAAIAARGNDPPIASDPYGNAIVGAVAGGVIAGLEGSAGAAKSVAKQAAVDAAAEVLAKVVPGTRGVGPAGSLQPSEPGEGGQSTNRGSSRVATEANRSENLRVPEAPAQALRSQG